MLGLRIGEAGSAGNGTGDRGTETTTFEQSLEGRRGLRRPLVIECIKGLSILPAVFDVYERMSGVQLPFAEPKVRRLSVGMLGRCAID